MRLADAQGMEHQAKRTVDAPHGFTLIELLMVMALLATLAAMSALYLMQAKKSANEASAIGTLRAINSGQTAFAATCGSSNYASPLSVLVSGHYLSADADISPRSGYIFNMTAGAAGPTGCGGQATRIAYYVSAEPLTGSHGRRAFATSQVGVIWQNSTGVAPTEPFAAGGTTSTLGDR